MKEIVRKNSFQRDKIIHKDIIGRKEDNSHTARSVSIETDSLTDKDISDVQALAAKVDVINEELLQASQAATTATESANAAGNLASQALQTAQEAAEIAESATTTAGEAVQSINEHASSTTNPHPANTTQSFAEVVITPLKSDANGGSVADADYNWFKGVYASLVDGSVLSWIKGLVNQVKSLATRVGTIEDNAYFDFFKIPTKHLRQYDYFNAARISASSSTTGAPIQDAIMLIPICLSDNVTIDYARTSVYTAFAGGKMRIGIYEGNPFYPYNLIWQSDEMTQDASGIKGAPASINLVKDKMYWFAFITNNITVRMYSYQIYQLSPIKGNDAVASNVLSILFANFSYGSLPATLDGLTVSEAYTYFPVISLRKA